MIYNNIKKFTDVKEFTNVTKVKIQLSMTVSDIISTSL